MAFDDATAAGLKFVKQAQDMAAALDKIGSAGQVAAPDVAKLVSETSRNPPMRILSLHF